VRKSGWSKLGFLLIVLGLGIGGYTTYLFGPSFVNYYRLKGAAAQIVKYSEAGVLSQTTYDFSGSVEQTEMIERAVLMEARRLEIPLRRQDITVEQSAREVLITVQYIEPIQLPDRVYNLTLSFTEHN
jgi:hypothetical protein